jgi:hypothetical protein
MIPEFDDNEIENSRVKFVKFIQDNKGIFDKLFAREYVKTANSRLNSSDISNLREGYHFFRNFALGDDADVYSLTEDIDEFNTNPDQTDVNKIINLAQQFLKLPVVKQEFKKQFNEKLLNEIKSQRNKMKEKKAKSRTMKRTAQFKDELLDTDHRDWMPVNKENSVFGKSYRKTRDAFNRRNNRAGGKTRRRRLSGNSNEVFF